MTCETITPKIEPTNTAVDRVLTLPAVAGTVFNQGNVVGTVSQSSGVPTGAIIERGSNANGEFVKYADGTMICTNRNDITPVANAFTLADFPDAPVPPQPTNDPDADALDQERLERIAELKTKLAETDYVTLSDYDQDKPDVIADRAAWRTEIRTLQGT